MQLPFFNKLIILVLSTLRILLYVVTLENAQNVNKLFPSFSSFAHCISLLILNLLLEINMYFLKQTE